MEIGWVDYSKKYKNKVQEYLNSIKEPGMYDALGIGKVGRAFSDVFFPSLNSNMRGAKYFFIVPYILREVMLDIKKGKNVNDAIKALQDKEKDACQALCNNSDDQSGIIGKNSLEKEGWISRKPSNIYFNAIKEYGIIDTTMRMDALLDQAIRSAENPEYTEDNEDNNVKKEINNIFKLPDNYVYVPNIKLTKKEADFLSTKIKGAIANDSLLVYLLENKIELPDVNNDDNYFETLYNIIKEKNNEKELPDGLKKLMELMELACAFNKLAYAAHVCYNYMVFSKKDTNNESTENSESSNALSSPEKLWNEIKENHNEYTAVDIEKVFNTLSINAPELKKFLRDFKDLLMAYSPEKNNDFDEEAKKKVAAREKAVKKKAKEPDDSNWIGRKYLDYRLGVGIRIINDIKNPMEVENNV